MPVAPRKGAPAVGNSRCARTLIFVGVLGGANLCFSACGDDGTGAEEEKTGAVLQGQVVLLGDSDETGNVKISIGEKTTKTSGNGSFSLNHIPVGETTATFSGSGITGPYSLTGIELGTVVTLADV